MRRRFVAAVEGIEQRSLMSTVSLFNTSMTPDMPDVNDPNSVEVGVVFHTDVSGTLQKFPFWETQPGFAQHTVTLWDSNGNVLERQDTADAGIGWKDFGFFFPVKIQANVNYTVSVLYPNGHYGDSWNFFTQPYDVAPLHATAGVYAYGPGGVLPTNTYRDSNYWVDVSFEPDVQPSFAVNWATASSAPGATAVSPNTQIFVGFTTPVDQSTIKQSNFQHERP